MATINIRVDDDLKKDSYAVLENLGVTPSEALRQTLQYIAQNKKLPYQSVLMTDDDKKLLAIAKERLNDIQPVKVNLDEL